MKLMLTHNVQDYDDNDIMMMLIVMILKITMMMLMVIMKILGETSDQSLRTDYAFV